MNIFTEPAINTSTITTPMCAPYMFPIDLENSINTLKKLPARPYITINKVNYTRFNFFNIGNPGYDAIKKNLKLSYKIGNYFFVHGQLTSSLSWEDHEKLTQELISIPDFNNQNLDSFLNDNNNLLNNINLQLNQATGPLWARIWGTPVASIGSVTTGANNRIGNNSGIINIESGQNLNKDGTITMTNNIDNNDFCKQVSS